MRAPGRAGYGAPQDAGCLRPNGCCSGWGLEEGGAERQEKRAAGPGPGGRIPGSLRCALAAFLRAGASHTKGLGNLNHRRLRGRVGSAQQGGAVAHPAPQTRPRALLYPTPLPPPSQRLSALGLCAPIPSPNPWGGDCSTQRCSWGPVARREREFSVRCEWTTVPGTRTDLRVWMGCKSCPTSVACSHLLPSLSGDLSPTEALQRRRLP